MLQILPVLHVTVLLSLLCIQTNAVIFNDPVELFPGTLSITWEPQDLRCTANINGINANFYGIFRTEVHVEPGTTNIIYLTCNTDPVTVTASKTIRASTISIPGDYSPNFYERTPEQLTVFWGGVYNSTIDDIASYNLQKFSFRSDGTIGWNFVTVLSKIEGDDIGRIYQADTPLFGNIGEPGIPSFYRMFYYPTFVPEVGLPTLFTSTSTSFQNVHLTQLTPIDSVDTQGNQGSLIITEGGGAYLKYDVSSIPPECEIMYARLVFTSINYTSNPGNIFSYTQLTKPWSSGTIDASDPPLPVRKDEYLSEITSSSILRSNLSINLFRKPLSGSMVDYINQWRGDENTNNGIMVTTLNPASVVDFLSSDVFLQIASRPVIAYSNQQLVPASSFGDCDICTASGFQSRFDISPQIGR